MLIIMTIERELLKKVISGDNKGDFFISYDLYKEIYEFLVHPEQFEQEPVAWKVIDGTNGKYMFSRVKPTERSYKYDVVIPLYTAPPKREPLSDEAVCQILLKKEWRGFVELVRIIEKAHGIGGGE